jgi:hypothetical protein
MKFALWEIFVEKIRRENVTWPSGRHFCLSRSRGVVFLGYISSLLHEFVYASSLASGATFEVRLIFRQSKRSEKRIWPPGASLTGKDVIIRSAYIDFLIVLYRHFLPVYDRFEVIGICIHTGNCNQVNLAVTDPTGNDLSVRSGVADLLIGLVVNWKYLRYSNGLEVLTCLMFDSETLLEQIWGVNDRKTRKSEIFNSKSTFLTKLHCFSQRAWKSDERCCLWTSWRTS